MTEEAGEVDWSGVSEKMARHIHGQGETYLKAQLQAALAADQRAMTVASVSAASAAAVLAIAVNYWSKAEAASLPIIAAFIGTAFALFVGAFFGVWAARPVAFWYPGNYPKSWYESRLGNVAEAIGAEAEHYNSHIISNDQILKANQKALRRGLLALVLSPVVGLLFAIVVSAPNLLCPAEKASVGPSRASSPPPFSPPAS